MKNRCCDKKKLLVFGYFGYKTNKLDGQTVKSRSILELLQTHMEFDVYYADTEEFRFSLKTVRTFICNLFICDYLIYMPAHNNFRYLFPIIFIFSLLFRFQIIYVVVGGWLYDYLQNLPIHVRMLRNIRIILVENELLLFQLKQLYNLKNVEKIPNFRQEPIRRFLPRMRKDKDLLRLVFMARINLKKGLDTLVKFAEMMNLHYPTCMIQIDFYGPIFDADKSYFEKELLAKYSFMHYCGILEPKDIVTVLQNYDVMLFPTHYFTEGFPGTILDAYRAGIPVIATRWKYASEFVIDGKTGYIVDFKNPVPELVDRVVSLYLDNSLLLQMKNCAYKESFLYTSEAAWNILKQYF